MVSVRFLLFLSLLGLGLGLAGAEQVPNLDPEDPGTEELLAWCANALAEAEKNPEKAAPKLESFEKILAHIEAIPPKLALKNKRFNADLQKMKNLYFSFVYEWALAETAKPGEGGKKAAREALVKLKNSKASSQYELPFLAATGDWKTYYAECRKNLNYYEKHPEDMRIKPPIPPVFAVDEELTPEALLDMLAIFDMCRQYQWEPDAVEEERILLGLSRQFEKNGRLSYAVSSLSMIPAESRSGKVSSELARLVKLASDQDGAQP